MDPKLYYAIGYRDALAVVCMTARVDNPAKAVRFAAEQVLAGDPDHCHAKAVLEKPHIEINQATLEFCRDALIRQIEVTYDEPGICDCGVAFELEFLRNCASDLCMDFDGVVREIPIHAKKRLEAALRQERNPPPEGIVDGLKLG